MATLERFFHHDGVVTAFVIHEDAEHVAALPSQVMINTKIGGYIEGGVGVVAYLARIHGEIYETWLNRHIVGGVEESFEDLATQEELTFNFYVDEATPARSIWIPNMDRETFASILETFEGLEPWSMEAFDSARAGVERRHPSVQDMWNALGDS
jgi:hypothetical protein